MRHEIQSGIQDLIRQQQAIFLDQLGDLVKKGLLVCEAVPSEVVMEADQFKYTLRQKVRFILKDQEYINKLEKENQKMKIELQMIATSIKDHMRTM